MMKYAPVALFAIVASVASAQPSITGLSGNVTEGSTLILSGANLGTKSPAAPFLWDNFEGGTNGAALGSPVVGAYGENDVFYDSSSPYAGSMSVRGQTLSADTDGQAGMTASWIPNTAGDVFVSMKWKVVSDFGTISPHNLKLLRINSHDPDEHGGAPNLNIGNDRGYTNFQAIANHGTASQDYVTGFTASDYTHGSWNDIAAWVSCGALNTADGFVGRYVNANYAEDTGIVTLSSSLYPGQSQLYGGYRGIYLSHYVSHDGVDVRVWFDNVYADTTLARVEIGNASTYTACTLREVQIPSAWSATEITLTINQGAFAADDDVWFFVVDSSGDYSTGYPAVIGSTGEASTTPDIQSATRSGGNAVLTWLSGDGGPYTAWLQADDVRSIVTTDTTVTIPMSTAATDVTVKDGTSVRKANIPE